ncbi:MAG TPA: 2-oxoglutarate dehydrogenase complex dihydrolipoyllysine-residue succinyltransferase [Stellaceae bacterium]|nr:2-oxoglutarate dehydrogenase complex dihydrolipoyllysine-residue succinyltransferase [Stellaceae bacterium]
MATEIVVPTVGESVTEVTVARWLKKVGDAVALDDPLVELETDKATQELAAQASGTLTEIAAPEGATIKVGGLLGKIGDGAGAPPPATAAKPAPAAAPTPAPPAPAREKPAAPDLLARSGPAVRKLVAETGVDAASIQPTGKGGRLTKADVMAARPAPAPASAPEPAARPTPPPAAPRETEAGETRVRMTRLRKRIAERLKEAQNTAAMLTTFNEADMSAVMALRERYRDSFEKKHGVRLGFMSFFIKASIVALKEIPAANAEIDGDDILYKNFYDIGVAVGAEQGLVVPVVRGADRMSFADLEKKVAELGRRARDGKLSVEELSGGTFTITNGGVFGSLLSTPILNPPQAAILGMHKIERRPVAVGDKVEIRSMMYLALSYDHRLIDGREAVTFLVRIKECIEEPERLLFEM